MSADPYRAFLEAKVRLAPQLGFAVDPADVNPELRPHVRAIVPWALTGGRRAIFARFGLHKTTLQIEMARLARRHLLGRGEPSEALIVLPLGVRQEFFRDAAERFHGEHAVDLRFIRRPEEIEPNGPPGRIYLTNYETIRDGKLDPRLFAFASLDEASVLRGFGGSKTFREFMRLFEAVRYRFVATATPSPNEHIELLAYAAYLDIMDVGQAKTRFFKRDPEKADALVIHPHKRREFWLWVASWALFIQKPSDLGFSDEGYDLPPIDLRWHEVASDNSTAGAERDGQGRMFRVDAIGVQDAAREKRDSLSGRIGKLMEIRAEGPDEHRLIWHDLEAERAAIERVIPDVVSVYGSQGLEDREQAIIDFSDGRFRELAAKPVIAGSGCNFQRHCAWAVFLGIGFKFNDFIQAIHRIVRFGQSRRVRIDIITTEAERDVRRRLERRWAQHEELANEMSEIIREYGLSDAAMAQTLVRSIGTERVEVSDGERGLYRLVNDDCVIETRRMEADSVDLIVTSIPFSTQYEYTPSYNDFGHTDDDAHFWAQMDHLIPELLRVLKPGRRAVIHVKDRITPGGINGLGFQTITPFSDDCSVAFRKHGFALLSRVTITTDVVRENNQTYRLGWSEQCKDGTRMGNGLPEYLLEFRKPPTDRSNGYADEPVVKDKPMVWAEDGTPVAWGDGLTWAKKEKEKRRPTPGTGYSRGRWQLDAHGFYRSSGDRLLAPAELEGLEADHIYKVFREFSLNTVYDFEHHVRIGEHLDQRGKLPPTFMLLPPQSWHPQVWSDVTRMLTLNGQQSQRNREMHLCPLQFDIVDRAIAQFTMKDEIVFDPFGGLMTVPYRAILAGRRGAAVELNPRYFMDGIGYVETAANGTKAPSLFDLLDAQAAPPPDGTGSAENDAVAASTPCPSPMS